MFSFAALHGRNLAVPRRFSGYSAAFAQLHNAARPSEDPTPDVHDPQKHLAAELARLSQVCVFSGSAPGPWCRKLCLSVKLSLHMRGRAEQSIQEDDQCFWANISP